MGAYLSTREVVGLGVVWSTFLFAGLAYLLVRLGIKSDRTDNKLEEISQKIEDSRKLEKMLDNTIELVRSVKSNTTITTTNKAGGGSANDKQ